MGLHELLGHGSGKLLQRKADGTTNYPSTLLDPFTGNFFLFIYLDYIHFCCSILRTTYYIFRIKIISIGIKQFYTFIGKPPTSCYEPGDTYDSRFGPLSSSYEECRAEAVGLYLSLEPEVRKMFYQQFI